jgi:hypothetical protein
LSVLTKRIPNFAAWSQNTVTKILENDVSFFLSAQKVKRKDPSFFCYTRFCLRRFHSFSIFNVVQLFFL